MTTRFTLDRKADCRLDQKVYARVVFFLVRPGLGVRVFASLLRERTGHTVLVKALAVVERAVY